MTGQLTTADRERLGALLDENRQVGYGPGEHGDAGDVPAATCARWRARRDSGEQPAEIADGSQFSKPTVNRHVNARCGHGSP